MSNSNIINGRYNRVQRDVRVDSKTGAVFAQVYGKDNFYESTGGQQFHVTFAHKGNVALLRDTDTGLTRRAILRPVSEVQNSEERMAYSKGKNRKVFRKTDADVVYIGHTGSLFRLLQKDGDNHDAFHPAPDLGKPGRKLFADLEPAHLKDSRMARLAARQQRVKDKEAMKSRLQDPELQ